MTITFSNKMHIPLRVSKGKLQRAFLRSLIMLGTRMLLGSSYQFLATTVEVRTIRHQDNS